MSPRLVLAALVALLLAGCGKAPYEDPDLAKALSGVDHIASSSADCHRVDLVWKCLPTVDLDPGAGAHDIAGAITATAGVLRDRGRDNATVKVGDTASADTAGPTGASAVLLAADGRRRRRGPVAGAGRDVRRHVGPGGVPPLPAPRQCRRLAGHRARGARSRTGRAPRRARRAPQGLPEHPSGPGDDVAGARALAERPSGYASIVAVDVTDDPDSDLSNAGEGAGHARTSADVLRKEPGYRGLSVSSGFLRVTVDTLEHAEAMDTTLRTSSARAYDAVETIYKVEGVATVTRAGGTSAWFDTTEALVASGLFDSVQVGEPEPRGRARAIDVVASDGVVPTDAARALARTWQPGRKVAVRLTWLTSRRAFTSFTAGETITGQPSPRVSQKIADAIERAWSQGRAE